MQKIKAYFRAWSLMRGIRAGLGLLVIAQGLGTGDTLSLVLGSVFAGMAFLNIGCNGSCAVNTNNNSKPDAEPEFEEVVVRK